MVLGGSSKRNKYILMKDKEKPLTKKQMEQLKIMTFSNCVYGSIAIKGWTYYKIINYKRKDKIKCLKQLLQ